jgi:hypothetical protein
MLWRKEREVSEPNEVVGRLDSRKEKVAKSKAEVVLEQRGEDLGWKEKLRWPSRRSRVDRQRERLGFVLVAFERRVVRKGTGYYDRPTKQSGGCELASRLAIKAEEELTTAIR